MCLGGSLRTVEGTLALGGIGNCQPSPALLSLPMPDSGDAYYSDEETRAIHAARPLRELDVNQIYLLNRHLIWSAYQRQRFEALVPDSTPPGDDPIWMVSEWFVSFSLWAALLWVGIEGFNERGIELGGRLGEDVAALSPTLKDFRNAVFHVSREATMTPACSGSWATPTTSPASRRVWPVCSGMSQRNASAKGKSQTNSRSRHPVISCSTERLVAGRRERAAYPPTDRASVAPATSTATSRKAEPPRRERGAELGSFDLIGFVSIASSSRVTNCLPRALASCVGQLSM